MFSTLEIPWLIEPNKKLLMEIDLSESTKIDFSYGEILSFEYRENFFCFIDFIKNLIQNKFLLL